MAENSEKIIIDVQHLEKQYLKHKVIQDVSFQVREGMICGLIGPNGAGKTTIMKMLGGLVLPDSGSIEILSKQTETGLAESRSRMSFVIETPYAKENMSAWENLEKQRLQKGIQDKSIIEKVLKTVGLEDVGNKKVKAFSLGMRQRFGIANALMTEPEIMILDEPINGLDPEGIVEIRELLLKLNREKHITIIISSHILSELSLLCTDYIFIHHGQILQAVSAPELKKICRGYYHIHTDNDALVCQILKEKLKLTDFEIQKDGSIQLYESLEQIREISRTLYENQAIPLILHMSEINLEQYYMNMIGTGGTQDA
ncbi:MAG: ABC transporter ATP-binding protein [Oscillospiraceae bacterium]|nr:ABC transporter ATP-binding protein [Oscillospiraceae bacterium]